SFWQCICEHLDITEKYVLNIWNDGYIMGFLSKEREMALLSEKLPGTFLLRFSENSRWGGIIITWVECSKDGGEPVVHSIKSYARTDLNNISLPNITHVDFVRYYTSASDSKDFTFTFMHFLFFCPTDFLQVFDIIFPLLKQLSYNKLHLQSFNTS
uniref:SH2 domain-containing protein n=1 Tax=Cyprinus carpio TaxID=7962 RepID=A0A8C1Y610_CYPCA